MSSTVNTVSDTTALCELYFTINYILSVALHSLLRNVFLYPFNYRIHMGDWKPNMGDWKPFKYVVNQAHKSA